MIEWLSSWLREIILVILLATFVDLILPNSIMQRYVKVVIGLFILLTILSPVISLFGTDLDIEKAALTMEQPRSGLISDQQTKVGGSMKSLQAIVADGTKMKSENQQQTLRYIETRLQEMVQENIEQTLQYPVHSVTIETKLDNHGEPQVESMRVILNRINHDPKSSHSVPFQDYVHSAIPIQKIQPIEPVSIRIEVDNSGELMKEALKDEQLPEAMELARKQVSTLIEKEWRIPSSQLEVLFNNDPG